jgi:hypothetical protein
MKRLQRDAVLLSVIENLGAEGSWCGETHIQKATYFVQELLKVPLEFDFILYKHGPFSFDLSDEITAMRADYLLGLQPRSYPYGPSIVHGESGEMIKEQFPKTLEMYNPSVEFVADKFGDKGVAELERISTALYVTLTGGVGGSVESRAQRIHELKPHVEMDEAFDAVKAVDEIIEEAREVQVT